MTRLRLAFCCLISACALLVFFRVTARAADAPDPETATQGRALYADRLAARLGFLARTQMRLADANLPGLAPDGAAARPEEVAALLRDVRCQPVLSARLAAMMIGDNEPAGQRQGAFRQLQKAVGSLRRSYFMRRAADSVDPADSASGAAFAALAKREELREARLSFLLNLWVALGANLGGSGEALLPLSEEQLDWLWERKTSLQEMANLGRVMQAGKTNFRIEDDLAGALLNPDAWLARRQDEALRRQFRSMLSHGWGALLDELLPEAASALLRPGTRAFTALAHITSAPAAGPEGIQANGLRLRRLPCPSNGATAAGGSLPPLAEMALAQGERLFELWGSQPGDGAAGGTKGGMRLWEGTPLSRLAAAGPVLHLWDGDRATFERGPMTGSRLLAASTRPAQEVAAHLGWLSAMQMPASLLPATWGKSGVLAVAALEELLPGLALSGGRQEADLLFGPLARIWIYRPGSGHEGAYWLEMAREGAPRPPCMLGESPLLSLCGEAAARAALSVRRDALRRQLAEFVLEWLPRVAKVRAPGNTALPAMSKAEADAVAARFVPFVDGETPPLEQFGQCVLGYLLLGGGEEQFASLRDILGDTAKPLQSRLNACREWLIPRLQNQRGVGS